jgi:hypothetical protein
MFLCVLHFFTPLHTPEYLLQMHEIVLSCEKFGPRTFMAAGYPSFLCERLYTLWFMIVVVGL